MGSKTTYYSLAKDRLKGKHPRTYNLILIFTLLSLTGTAAFLISDLLSFSIDCDNSGVQSSKGILSPDKSSLLPSPLTDSRASREAAKDTAQEKGPTLSVLDANSSPSDRISSQSTVNSTEEDELGKASREQNSSQNSSIAGQTRGSTASAKKAGTSTSISKSHSSSGSSGSSSSSRSSSSSEKKVEEKADVQNNESANLQSSKPTAGIYRNESPQNSIILDGGKASDSGPDPLKSETASAMTDAMMKTLVDEEGSAKASNAAKGEKQALAEMPAKTEPPARIRTPNKATPAKAGMAVEIETTANQETSIKTETTIKTMAPVKAEIKLNAETTAKIETPENAKAPVNDRALDKTETVAKTETPVKAEIPVKAAEGPSSTPSDRAFERQESRSKQTNDMAREKSEHNEGAAIERAQSYSSIEKEGTEKSESARTASLMATQRNTKLQDSRSEKGEDTAERKERNDAAISAKALAAPSISEDGKRASLPSAASPDSQRDGKSDAALGPASSGSPSAQEGKEAASLCKASASLSRAQAQRELKSSRSEQSEKIANIRADRTDDAAASKASATALRIRDLSERMKAKEKARETAISAANAKREMVESRSRPAAE